MWFFLPGRQTETSKNFSCDRSFQRLKAIISAQGFCRTVSDDADGRALSRFEMMDAAIQAPPRQKGGWGRGRGALISCPDLIPTGLLCSHRHPCALAIDCPFHDPPIQYLLLNLVTIPLHFTHCHPLSISLHIRTHILRGVRGMRQWRSFRSSLVPLRAIVLGYIRASVRPNCCGRDA